MPLSISIPSVSATDALCLASRGADQPIILDFQYDAHAPDVCRLALNIVRSGPEGRRKSWNNHWIEIAPSFDHFARLLGFV
jgi:hypothetical protein